MTDDGICFRTTQLESDGQDRPLTFSAAVAQAEALPDPPQVALLNHLWHLRDTGGFDGAQKLQIEETECTMTYLRDGGGRRVSPYLIEDGLEDETARARKFYETWSKQGKYVEAMSALAALWLRNCFTGHTTHCHSKDTLDNSNLPTRLVDLEHFRPSDARSRVRVVTTDKIPGAYYCALSYRWPPAGQNMVTLTVDNVDDMLQHGVEAGCLIEDIQDACRLAKGLGLRYLWVDSLCIVQGAGGSWHVEVERMASTYMNALFTIAAVDGTRLAMAAQFRPFLSGKLTESPNLQDADPEQIHRALQDTGNFISRPTGVLDTRGWTLQEKMLSRRTISITSEGIFWDCLTHSACDRRPCGILGDWSPGHKHSDDMKFKRLLLKKMSQVSPENPYGRWREAVEEYTSRDLSYGTDRLAAMDGIKNQMSSLLGDECVLGIWKKDAVRSLLWFRTDRFMWSKKVGSSKSDNIEAPSWSWASVKGQISCSLFRDHEYSSDRTHEHTTELATVHHVSYTNLNPRSLDKFSGSLILTGALIHRRLLLEFDIVMGRLVPKYKIWVPDNRASSFAPAWRYYPDIPAPTFSRQDSLARANADSEISREEKYAQGLDIFCLPLMRGGYSRGPVDDYQYCLVLEKRPGSTTTYNKMLLKDTGSGAEYGPGPRSSTRNISAGGEDEVVRLEDYRRVGYCMFYSDAICLSSRRTCPDMRHRKMRGDDSECLGHNETINIV